jgi:aryl carrier-like protein
MKLKTTLQEERNKIPITELVELLTSPTKSQWWATVKVEDYGWKESIRP